MRADQIIYRACAQTFQSVPTVVVSGLGAYTGVFSVALCPIAALILYAVSITYILIFPGKNKVSSFTTKNNDNKLLGLCVVLGIGIMTGLVWKAKSTVWTLARLGSASFILLIDLLLLLLCSSQFLCRLKYYPKANYSYFYKSFLLGIQVVCVWSLGMMTERCCGQSAGQIVGDGECNAIDNLFLCYIVPKMTTILLLCSILSHYWQELRWKDESLSKTPLFAKDDYFYRALLYRAVCLSGRQLVVLAGWLGGVFLIPLLFYVFIAMGMSFLFMAARLYALLIGGTCLGIALDRCFSAMLGGPLLVAMLAMGSLVLLFYSYNIFVVAMGVTIGALWCRVERRQYEQKRAAKP